MINLSRFRKLGTIQYFDLRYELALALNDVKQSTLDAYWTDLWPQVVTPRSTILKIE